MNNGMPECPVEIVMIFLKDRVGVLIIGYLLQESQTPARLQNKIGNISLPILIKRMKAMGEWGLIESDDTFISEATDFRITQFGRSFETIIKEMEYWGANQKVYRNGNGI